MKDITLIQNLKLFHDMALNYIETHPYRKKERPMMQISKLIN